jgi:hypothetical protein
MKKSAIAVVMFVSSIGLFVGTTEAAPSLSERPSNQPIVTPGAFCSSPNALGKTKKGVQMKCTYEAWDDRSRWRAK